MADDKLGISFQLPAGAAEALRDRYRISSELQESVSDHHQLHQLVSLQPLSRDPDDDWNEEIALPVPEPTDALDDATNEENIVSEDDAHVIEDEESSKEDDDDEEDEEEDDDDDLSLTPPASLPVVLVDLERLVGYQPSSTEEAELLRAQVHTALWGQEEPVAAVSNPQEQEGGVGEPVVDDLQLASQFDERAAALFENGIARHSDSSQLLPNSTCNGTDADGTDTDAADDSVRFIAMEYPEYVCRGDSDPPVVLNTARVWKLLLQPHSIETVDRLLRHLCSCSRSLLWKDSMRAELIHLAASEEDARIRRNQSSELKVWKEVRRKEQLDKLYTVRETFEHRIEIARQRLVTLEKERDDKAALEIRQRRLERGEDLGLEAFDFASTVFAFTSGLGDGNMRGLDEEDEYGLGPLDEEKDDYSDEDGNEADKSGNDDDDDDEEADPAVADSSDVGDLAIPSRGGQSKRRRQAAVRKRRHRLEEAAKDAEHRSKLDAAKAEEEHMREKCTTQEFKMAVAVVGALEGRMEEVEALLESLQDEEWVDEEEGVDTLTPEQRMLEGAVGQQPKKDDLTLLDQILAMILGATLPCGDISIESHVQKLQDEHLAIMLAWKDHFGRLPPPAVSPAVASFGDTSGTEMQHVAAIEQEEIPVERTEAKRQIFGIVDNEIDDWEDQAWEDQGQQAVEAEAPVEVRIEARPTPVKAGLRPGGRLQ
jgi:hypothetical protein